MKAMICEICNGNDLVKQDGLFVCQYCGTKYSAEEARKLFVEGSVKIDHSDEIKNLYILARRAREDGNDEAACKYYESILLKEPSSWEAAFYTVYYPSLKVDIDHVRSVSTKLSNCEDTVLKLIKETVTDPSEQKKVITEIAEKLMHISRLCFAELKKFSDIIAGVGEGMYKDRLIDDYAATANMLYRYGDDLLELFGDRYTSIAIDCWKFTIEQLATCRKKYADKTVALAYADKIKKSDPSYEAPTKILESDGCYVATSIYGSYDCPQVWTLRRFRDSTLKSSWYGRCFVRVYYAISPTLVREFGEKSSFKRFFTPLLDRLVKKLNDNGVEDTPYRDKY